MAKAPKERELWVLGLGDKKERAALVCSYLAEAGYWARTAQMEEFEEQRPLAIVLDISPHAEDGWGILLKLKSDERTRSIPILPVFLSAKGKVGGVFPVGGFFTLPLTPKILVPPSSDLLRPLYHSTPPLMICGMFDRVSTFWTTVGRPQRPLVCGNGGLERGLGRLPSSELSNPVSSPHM